MSVEVYSVPCQTEGRKKTFLECKSTDLSLNYLIHVGTMTIIISAHHPIATRGNRENPGNVQNKSVSGELPTECPGIFSSWLN